MIIRARTISGEYRGGNFFAVRMGSVMRRIEPFFPEHAEQFNPQSEQRDQRAYLDQGRAFWQSIAARGEMATLYHDDAMLLIGGPVWVTPTWARWVSVLSEHVGPADMLWLHRIAAAWIATVSERKRVERMDAEAQQSFTAARRWLRMLGFEPEHREGATIIYVRPIPHERAR